jgi:hypothetical protein
MDLSPMFRAWEAEHETRRANPPWGIKMDDTIKAAESTALLATMLPMAASLYAYYSALIREGFDVQQALLLTVNMQQQVVAIALSKPQPPAPPS